MTEEALYSIAELATVSGLSPRAIRFYVQRGLLTPPLGRGRGRHYGGEHLERLRQIQQLQSAGHSLDAIKRIIQGQPVTDPEPLDSPRKRRAVLSAQLWTRVECAEGVELHVDTAKVDLELSQLLALQEAIQRILKPTNHLASGEGRDVNS